MKRNNRKDGFQVRLENIKLDLDTYKVLLHFQNHKDPLVIHFDKPARRFYFSLIALVVTEMKKKGKPDFIHIRKHEKTLKLLDNSLAGPNASKTVKGMWDKIRKAWRHRLPGLETAILFKVLDRNLISPYEKEGKYRYECSDDECDTWANLFGYDESNPWRFKFAIDSASLNLNDISLTLGDLQDNAAWQEFMKRLSSVELMTADAKVDREKTKPKRLYRVAIIAVGFLTISVATATIWNLYFRPVPSPAELELLEKPSIAVLPFVNMSDTPEKDYFCDGITEEIINNLSKLKDLRVISRTSAFYFKDKDFDIRTIGEKLDVDNIMEGSVRISGNQLRISAKLIKVADDSHLWSETYERKMEDIFATQENLARVIACSLKSRLGCNGDEIFSKHSTENLDAYKLYLKGRYLKNKFAFQKAKEYFEQAITVVPHYALAYAGLANAYTWIGFIQGEAVNEYYLKARAAALKALELDGMLSEAHASMGQIKNLFEWDWDGAEASLQQAIELLPGNSQTHFHYYYNLRARGRLNKAKQEIELALHLDPFALNINLDYGTFLHVIGEVDSAIHHLEKTFELFPESPNILLWIGLCYLDKGEFNKALSLIEKVLNHPKAWRYFSLAFAGYAYAIAGKSAKAHEILDEVLQEEKNTYFPPHFISLIYNGLGNEDKMFEYLEKAHNQRDPYQYTLKVLPWYQKYHSDPRFISLMKRMGFEG
jgi:TolB-like protein